MIFKYPFKVFPVILALIILNGFAAAFAQAPNITYPTPQAYTINTPIPPLSPANTGGSVPSNTYGLVTIFASNGKNGQGPGQSFNQPHGIAIDASGNLFVADGNTGSILKIDPSGVVSNLQIQFTPAITIWAPVGIAIDANNNLYVSDGVNQDIWKITAAGAASILAGHGVQGSSNGQGAAASFNYPDALVLDNAGNLYVGQAGSIREITPAGIVSTFLNLSFTPGGLVIDGQNNMYVSDEIGAVLKITPNKVTTILAGDPAKSGSNDGTGTTAAFNAPHGLVLDKSGNLYVADSYNNLVRKITPAGVVTTIAGNIAGGSNGGIGTSASFNNPIGITINAAGDLLVTDANNNLIRKISLTGYTIDKPPPAGLTFDPGTGTISGTPIALSPATDYTITANNGSGSHSFTVNIRVNNSLIILPPKISYPTPQVYTVNTPIASLMPTNTGGAISADIYGVTTFAGSTGTSGTFSPISGVKTDGAGDLYVTDASQRILKITPDGVLTTIAGKTNTTGYADGQGTAALFNNPQQIATDASGNIYVADANNNAIRKITLAGVVTTYAGTGARGSSDGPAATATFNHPTGLAFDSQGNLYVADFNNNSIRKITPAGTVSTFAGLSGSAGATDGTGPSARFSGPNYLAIDASDNIYVSDFNNILIRKITPAAVVTTLAGNGTAGLSNGTGTNTSFNKPGGMAIDAEGNLYVADEGNFVIRQITPAGVVSTFAGNGKQGATNGYPLTSIAFADPRDITIDASGDLYLADGGQIRKINPSGYTIDKPLPAGLAFDPATGIISGTPTAASTPVNYTITAYNVSGSSSFTVNIAVEGALPTTLPPNISYQTPQLYTINKTIAPLTPLNTGGAVPANVYGQISTFAGSGIPGKADGAGKAASFNNPAGVAIDAAGNVYIGDSKNLLIRKITPAGLVTTIAAYSGGAFGVATDAAGNIYVADAANKQVEKITPAGTVTIIAGSFNTPMGIAVDAAGNVYVADQGGNLIRKITPAGVVSTFAGSGAQGATDGAGTLASFNRPAGLVVDASGNVYVADMGNNLIRKISPAGLVTTFAGSGNAGSADGSGTQASFNQPEGIAINAGGNLYIADTGNDLIRKIISSGVVTTVAGDAPGSGIGQKNFDAPTGIAIDVAGNAYVSEFKSDIISKIILTGYSIDKLLPAGLTFDATTGTISGTPAAVSPATDYTITAYNAGGNSSFKVNITVINKVIVAQAITFGPLPVKTYGDADFSPGATSSNNTIPISYTSDNTSVATIVNGEIHITGAGTANITATQDGNDDFKAATPVTQLLTVNPAELTITADDKTKVQGQANPVLTFSHSAFAYNEGPAQLTTQPVLTTTATINSPVGQYPIAVDGAASPNYSITFVPGTLTITLVPPSIVVPNAFTPNGDGINDYWNIKSLTDFPQCTVSVYARNGSLVFQSKGYPKPWDGTYKGSPLPSGTYYYIINAKNGAQQIAGSVTILR